MRHTDYDRICQRYDGRYERTKYEGTSAALIRFLDSDLATERRTLEVGTGTAHWLRLLQGRSGRMTGVDPSNGMLSRAREMDSSLSLARARAEALPFESGTFTSLFCVNALHHFDDHARFLSEAHRVLRSSGRVMSIGLDPGAGRDLWWIYEFFPETRRLDLERYPTAQRIQAWMAEAGFERSEASEVERIRGALTVDVAERKGFLDRASTSQLTVLTDSEYGTGLERIRRAREAAAMRGCDLILRADLRLYGTVGWKD